MNESGNSAAVILRDDGPALAMALRRVVGVQFRRAAAMIYDFDAAELPLPHDTRVIVETERGEAIGWTVGVPEDREPHLEGALRRILRVVGSADESRRQELQSREHEALRFCATRARQLQLSMKVIAVEWAHSGEKAAFYFSSEERIDFRTLVRDLAQHYRVRVEMRQVGPRDEAKIIGALGPCGRETCCSSWMRAFTPVSIKMAKDQGLAISPAKVTGVCGRLLCCLSYEQDTYRDLRRKLPRYGKQVMTPQGAGKVIDVLVLRERVRVLLQGGEGAVEFAATEVRTLGVGAVADEPETDNEAAALTDELLVEAPVELQRPVEPQRPVERQRPARPERPSRPERRPEQDRRPAQSAVVEPSRRPENPKRPEQRTSDRSAGQPPRKPVEAQPSKQAPPPKPAAPEGAVTSDGPASTRHRHRQRHRRGPGGGSGGSDPTPS